MKRAALLLALTLGPATAHAQADGNAGLSWSSLVADFEPARDDPAEYAELIAVSTRGGQRSRLIGFLDSLVAAEALGPTGMRYWGALALDADRGPAPVFDAFDSWLAAHPADDRAAEAFVTLLLAHRATEAASELVARAEQRGRGTTALALPRGAIRLEEGDPVGAVEAWVEALEVEDRSEEAARRIGEVLAESGAPTRGGIREALARAHENAAAAVARRLAPLLARAWAREGRWEEALRAALDPALAPTERAAALRGVAGRAGEQGAWGAARRAIEAILDMGPPVARTSDRLALVEIARRSGDPAAAARAGREAVRAGVPSARVEAAIDAVAAARLEGDEDSLERAVDRARKAGAPDGRLAVAAGDLALARGRADSALAAYDAAFGGPGAAVRDAEIEALERQRMVLALVRDRVPDALVARVGAALIEAPADPIAAAERLENLAAGLDAESGTAWAILSGRAAEWMGRGGEASAASAMLERTAREAAPEGERPRLLLRAGSWAWAAGDTARARALWTGVATEHDGTPYALEARRLLAARGDASR